MKLDGSIRIEADPHRVWDAIVDPLSLAPCIPGVHGIEQLDERRFAGSITASVGPIDGDFAFASELTDLSFPSALGVSVSGSDSVTRSRVRMVVRASLIQAGEDATELRYHADVGVDGRLAILGEMVLRATAGVIVGQMTKCLRSRLEQAEPASPDGAAIPARERNP